MSDVQILPEGGSAEGELPFEKEKKGRAKNWARIPAFVDRMKAEVIPMLSEIRRRRSGLNEMWARLFKVWSLEHEDQGYVGTSNVYVPAGKKVGDTLVSQLVSATFPGDDNFSVEARRYDDPTWAQRAVSVKETLKYRVENTARLRVASGRFYRQLVLTGNSPVKFHYRREYARMRQRARPRGELFGMPLPPEDVTLRDTPVFETIDASNFYAFPEDVNDLCDAELIFEDMTVSLASLRRRAAQDLYDSAAVERAGRMSRNPEKTQATQEKLRAQGIPVPNEAANHYGMVDLTELHIRFDPSAPDMAHEKDARWMLITVTSAGEVLRAIDNPWWHGRPPYALGRMGTNVGRLYGTGFIEGIRELNVLLNDQTNQGMDCATYALNPITLTNPDLIQGALAPLAPGVQWLVQDVNRAVRTITPPMEPLNATSILTTQTQAWINDYGGAPPVLQGGSAPGRAFRTATGIGTAQRNASVPLQEIVRLCEAEVFEQSLFHFWALDQQFANDDMLIYFSGESRPRRVDPRTLAGDWMFKWMASTQTSNLQVKGNNILQLLNLVASPPMVQAFQQNRLRFNPKPWLKRLCQEVYGFRDIDDAVVEDMAKMMGPPPGRPPELGQGQPPPPEFGGEPPIEDSGEFSAMRDEANDLAAGYGGMGAFSSGNGEDLTGEA